MNLLVSILLCCLCLVTSGQAFEHATSGKRHARNETSHVQHRIHIADAEFVEVDTETCRSVQVDGTRSAIPDGAGYLAVRNSIPEDVLPVLYRTTSRCIRLRVLLI